jgi:RNA polymerase sigma factor for flagellar operon FliA
MEAQPMTAPNSQPLHKLDIEVLWSIYNDTKSPEVRNEIVARNMGLAQYVGHRYRAHAPAHQSIEDIISYAYEGLIDAVEKYDSTLGFKFPTYAVRRVSGAILDGLRKEDPLPRSARKRVKDFEQAATWLFEVDGRELTQKELAERMGISQRELGVIQRDSFSQYKFIGDEDVPVTYDTRHDDPELYTAVTEVAEHLADKLSKLNDEERAFVLAYYGSGLTLTEMADILDVSEARLVQMRKLILDTVSN